MFNGINHQFQQFIILVEHFVKRFIYSEIIKSENHRREMVLILTVVLIGIGGYISYEAVSRLPHTDTAQYAWTAKTYFITLMMVLSGIVSLITWDKVLLDRKDLNNLLPLPVKTGTLVAAKFFSTFAFVVLVTIAFGLLSIFIFTGYLADKAAINPIYFAFCYFLTLLAANLFVFLFFSLLQSLLMLVFKEKWFKKISIFFQTFFLAGLMSVFAWFPLLYDSLFHLQHTFSPLLYWCPPLWFVGLNEIMIGSKDILFSAHPTIVLMALTLLLFFYWLFSAAGYRRILANEGVGKPPFRFSKSLTPFINAFNALLLRNLQERAIFYFVLKTFKRNWQYKAHLVVYIVLPLSFIVSRLLYLYYDNLMALPYAINSDTLSVLLALGFSLAPGLRTIVLHPDSLEANWMFKVTDITYERFHYINGLKKALVLLAVVPLFTVFFLFHSYFWGITRAFFHSFYGFSLTLLVLEISFFNYKKIPFTSPYISGKVNLKFWWPFMLAGFVICVLIFARLELFLMDHDYPLWFIGFYVLVYSMIFLIRRWQKSANRRFEFIFEEEPETVMTSLNFPG